MMVMDYKVIQYCIPLLYQAQFYSQIDNKNVTR